METILWILAGLFGFILYLSVGVGLESILKAMRKYADKKGWDKKGIYITEKKVSGFSAWIHILLWPLEIISLMIGVLIAIAGVAFAIVAAFALIVGVIGLIFFFIVFALSVILALIYFVCSLVFSGISIVFVIITFVVLCAIILWLLFFLIVGVLGIPETIGNLLTKGTPVSYKEKEEEKEKPKIKDNSFFQDPPSSRVAE